ncbi:single-stranded-DNA-specific exonuclease RecJ [Lichenibacterium dinghuense]|uniref:single-stranded-DNA-specific exonuclease RecJ n=1 Tax=Lichenibacterium dinghuense TaxID=2895977 RepID=UPI001F0255D1|nr:single-stranded-DNA-specific exonuclease RecJ [Lichenibacterium sp. 6Y81]
MNPLVLDVARSMTGRAWRARLDEAGARRAAAIAQSHGMPDLLSRVLASRGRDVADCAAFLDPSLRALMPDPDVLADMPAAVERLARAVRAGESVAVLGDYDVDGACAAALLVGYLRAAGLDPAIHIPDRLVDGYGPSVPAVAALATGGATLLVMVDCGSTSLVPLEEAARRGLDTVVIDHHQLGAELPRAAALVNANRPDDLSGLGHLCAAGAVFMVLVALHRALKASGFWDGRAAPDLLAALDLVALATVADVVPLTGLNRAFVAKGLAVMARRARPGLAALFDVAGADGAPSPFHLGYLVGPRINAGGRIGDSALGTRLLLTPDPVEAARIAADLDRLNRERRVIELAAVEEAEAEALALVGGGDSAVIVAAAEGWHPGVVGLVAARLRERFDRPAFAIALAGDTGTGSGRSTPGADLGAAVRLAVERGLLLKGGGHGMAAGVTLPAASLPAFRDFLHDHFADAVARSRAEAALEVDGTLGAGSATPELIGGLEAAGPFGAGAPEPVVALPSHRVVDCGTMGEGHLRATLAGRDGSRIRAVAFRVAEGPLGQGIMAARGKLVHAAGTLTVNRWGGGGGRPELRLLDAALVPDQPG